MNGPEFLDRLQAAMAVLYGLALIGIVAALCLDSVRCAWLFVGSAIGCAATMCIIGDFADRLDG
jgi:hypothetical protein